MSDTLLIRADAPKQRGIGHVMRMIAVGQAWQKTGGHVVFCGMLTEELDRLLIQEGFEVCHMPHVHPHSDDLRRTCALVAEKCPRWLAADGYHFDAAYFQALRDIHIPTLLVEDIPNHALYNADILLVQGAESPEKGGFTLAPHTRACFGPTYALLRREFTDIRPDRHNVCPQHILVSCGGEDPHQCTLRMLQALQQIRWNGQVTALAGLANAYIAPLRTLCERVPGWSTLTHSPMAPLLAQTDILLGAGGGTCWETCFMGVPSFCVSVEPNQTPVLQRLSEKGVVYFAGILQDLSDSALATQLAKFLDDHKMHTCMSQACQALVDGQGACRIVDYMRYLFP